MARCWSRGDAFVGESARRTGLSQDTIRFYIRKGLLLPQMGREGGRNPYRHFCERDVSVAAMIRFAQSLGMSLKEIADIARELQSEGISPEREVEVLGQRLARLERKAAELMQLISYLRAKRDWIAQNRAGGEPQFSADPNCLGSLVR